MTFARIKVGRSAAISLIVAMVLAVVSLVASIGHASAHCHRHGAPHKHAQAPSPDTGRAGKSDSDGAVADEGNDEAGAFGHQHQPGHSDCCDVTCHCGGAILANSISLSTPLPAVQYRTSASIQPVHRVFGLERPPQLSLRA